MVDDVFPSVLLAAIVVLMIVLAASLVPHGVTATDQLLHLARWH